MADTQENQHFVPQFYLRGFTIPGHRSLVWELDKSTRRFGKVPKSVRSICSRRRYYRQVRADGVEDPDLLERGFSTQLEHKMAPLLHSVIARLRQGTLEFALAAEEWGQFCYLIASQYTRVPSFRDKMALFMAMRGEQLFDELVAGQRRDGTLPPAVDDMLQRRRPTVKIEDWGTIKTMLEAATSVSNALLDRTPGFLRCPAGRCFVTSDNPVSYYIKGHQKYHIWQLEPVHPDAEVLFPLSHDSAVIIHPNRSGHASARQPIRCRCMDLSPRHVEAVNAQTVSVAERYVYAPMPLEELSALCREPASTQPQEGDASGA